MAVPGEESKVIFMHHMDTYEVDAIKKILITENLALNCSKYEIVGCVHQAENVCKIMHEKNPMEIITPTTDNFIAKIIESDIMIFNARSPDFETVCNHMRQVIAALEEWTAAQKKLIEPDASPDKKKYLILISTPMTWAMSKNEVRAEEDGDIIKDYLYEDDYRRRKAHKAYCKHKLLERDVIWVQKKCKHFVRTLVVCPGVIYGDENYTFHYIFKLGFYNKLVPVLKPGSQKIPMIYIKDYVMIMKQIIDNFPEAKLRYIFAVQPRMLSLKTFTYNLCKSFNGDCSKVRFLREIEMLMMDKDLFPQSTLDLLALDIKVVPTYLKDFPFHELTETFWDDLAEEFRNARNLHPLKIVLDGPPLVGKTEHSTRLAEYYHLLYVDIREIIYVYINYLEEKINNSIIVVEAFECPEQLMMYENEEEEEARANVSDVYLDGPQKISEEDGLLILDMKDYVEKWSKELFKLKVYVASHKTFEDQDYEHTSECLINLISTKQYNKNQGYILDGFPFTYEQARQIYFNTRQPRGIGFAKDVEPKPESESSDNLNILRPTHVAIFDAIDELLCKRAMGFTETESIMRRCLRHQMLPRLDAYRERNDEPHCLANIFYDNDLIPTHIFVDYNTLAVDTLRMLKNVIGPPFTYPLTSAQQKALNDALAETRQKEEMEQRRKKDELIKNLTLQRERKLLDWTAKFEELRRHQHEMREVKTLPLRQYLGKYVLPTLTEGILKIAELKPDDPVDFLAEYLFKCNPEGQQMPPFCTEEQRERFYDRFNDEITSDSEYMITKSRLICNECEELCPQKK